MSKFKKGDVVEVVKSNNFLLIGRTYTVADTYIIRNSYGGVPCVRINHGVFDITWFSEDMFRKIEPPAPNMQKPPPGANANDEFGCSVQAEEAHAEPKPPFKVFDWVGINSPGEGASWSMEFDKPYQVLRCRSDAETLSRNKKNSVSGYWVTVLNDNGSLIEIDSGYFVKSENSLHDYYRDEIDTLEERVESDKKTIENQGNRYNELKQRKMEVDRKLQRYHNIDVEKLQAEVATTKKLLFDMNASRNFYADQHKAAEKDLKELQKKFESLKETDKSVLDELEKLQDHIKTLELAHYNALQLADNHKETIQLLLKEKRQFAIQHGIMENVNDMARCESDFTWRICKELEACGALVFAMRGTGAVSGLPDRLVIHRDWTGFIEFKGPTGEVRANQSRTIKECCRRGFPAVVVMERVRIASDGRKTSHAGLYGYGETGYGGVDLISICGADTGAELIDALRKHCHPRSITLK